MRGEYNDMAIPVVEFFISLRYALGDMQGLNVSDYQLLEPINQAVSKLYGYLSQRYVHAVLKRSVIDVDDSQSYELPPDYVRVHQVYGDDGILVPTSINPPARRTYRIIGHTFYAKKGTYSFEYYYIPSRVHSAEDNLDVSESMRSYVEQVALAMYQKNIQQADYIIQQAEATLAGREISHFENTGPAQVLGGKV